MRKKDLLKTFSLSLLFVISLASCVNKNNNGESTGGGSGNPTPNQYTVIWKNWDGSVLETDYNVPSGTYPSYDGSMPTKPADNDYTYTWKGWNPEPTIVKSNQTYTATYSQEKNKEKYVINFDLDGGSSPSYMGSQMVEAFTKEVFFFDCVKEGWNFRGWSYQGTKIFDEKGNQLATPTLMQNMTFVAIYAQTAKMTIVTNLEGAGTITGEGEYPYNTYVDVSAYAKQGYVFIGWYFEDNLLSNTEDYKYMMWSDDVTLEARFKLDSFLMNIHTNNANYGLVLLKGVAGNNYQEQYIEYRNYTSTISIAAYSKTDVRFLGWYDIDNKLVETNAVYNFVMPNYNYTLEAKWNYFTISYNLNGGTNDSSNPTSYTMDSNSLTLRNPTRTGYEFLGWQYKGNYVSEVNPSWVENITLNAIWKATEYSILYELNGGTNNSSNPTSYTIESNTVTLSDASRNGYTFDGWYKDSTFSYKVMQISKGSCGDLVLYAKWTPVSYSIIYNLDGGVNSLTNPSTYTIESSFALSSPTKTGYTFLGWFDDNGNQVLSISPGTTGTLILNAKWNEGDAFSIILDANGGSVSETLIFTQYGHTYILPIPDRLGYRFGGWYDGSTMVDNVGTWEYTVDKTFVAHWVIISYSIYYTLNGGTNNSNNPSSYTVEDSITFLEPTKTGYTFLGWFIDENLVTGITTGTTGTIRVKAKWCGILNNLSVTSADTSKGTVTIASGSGYSGELITVVATPVGDYEFKGWFHDDVKISENSSYTFTMPINDYSLVAYFYSREEKYATHPILSVDGKTITYGLYPQTNVDDVSLVSALNALTTPESNGWYLYNGVYYAKLKATPHVADSTYSTYVSRFDNGKTIVTGTTYWFKCEPITWKILASNNDEFYLLSDILLDAHRYNEYYLGSKDGIYASNYEHSEIRSWLNNDFYNTAFSLDKSCIQITNVDNSVSTTWLNVDESYACNDTQDKVFLPSYKDYINSSYGFSNSSARYCKTTDYARARGAIYETFSSYHLYNGWYWTRSPRAAYTVQFVQNDGSTSSAAKVDDTTRCVRPAITVKIA